MLGGMNQAPSVTRGPATKPSGPERLLGGKYRLSEELGRGGRGAVFRAVQVELDRDVAIKILTDPEDSEGCERFLREAKVTAEIRHPCVAEVYDTGVTDDGRPFYVMEVLEGETLGARIAREGTLAPEVAVPIVAGIASALTAVHQRGFIHRDVKPSNIFLARREDGGTDPKLLDFGIAKRFKVEAEEVARITQRGMGPARGGGVPKATVANVIVGTPRYLSPEQISGDPLDARTDVYSLAATLYEALTGGPVFESPTTAELLAKILTEAPAPISRRAPGRRVPEALERAVRKGLAKNPDERWASPSDLKAALWAALAEAQGRPSGSELLVIPESGAGTRRALAGVAAFAFLVLVTLLVVRRGAPPASPAAASPSATAAEVEAAPPPPPPPEATAPTATQAPSPPTTANVPRKVGPVRTSAARATAVPSAAPPPASAGFRIDDLKAPF